jgi:N-methylhydantoinase A
MVPVAEYKVSADVGGTFTDVAVSDLAGALRLGKALSTPDEPFRGVTEALTDAAAGFGLAADELLGRAGIFLYATTAATNAILTGATARTALLTTAGHRDILTLREGGRPDPFDYSVPYGAPYVPRGLTFEVPERVTAEGQVLVPLESEAARDLVAAIAESEVESVAVCLLWSIVNPVHELVLGELLRTELPEVAVTLSHQVNPIAREYRRASSTAIDASLKPLARAHFAGVEEAARKSAFAGEFLVVTSAAGVFPAAEAAETPIHIVKSGPSMAPVAARAATAGQGAETLIVCDAGGTSFEVSLVTGGQVRTSRETWIGPRYLGHITGVSAAEVKSIGSGGGSIAAIDPGGMLRVGPESAGSEPGPAAYGRGGTEPTVTDAAVVLGYLRPELFLGGRLKLRPELAADAIEASIARPLGLSVEEAAESILVVASHAMADAIHEMTAGQGIDAREAVLVAGGGAGGLTIARIADQLEIETVVVPRTAGGLSACGAQVADATMDFSVNRRLGSDRFDLAAANAALDGLDVRCDEFLETLAGSTIGTRRERSVEAHYADQVWELEVPLPAERLDDDAADQLRRRFDAVHESAYAVSQPGELVEFVQWHSRAVAVLPKPDLASVGPSPAGDALLGVWPVWFDRAWHQTSYLAADAVADRERGGPAVIVEPTTTLVVPPGWRVELGAGSYRLRRNEGGVRPVESRLEAGA